jgi:hypothetical protein
VNVSHSLNKMFLPLFISLVGIEGGCSGKRRVCYLKCEGRGKLKIWKVTFGECGSPNSEFQDLFCQYGD